MPIYTLEDTDSSMRIHDGKFFDREVLNDNVVGTSTEGVGDNTGLDHVAEWIIVEVNNVVGVIEPPLAGADGRQCG